MKIGEIGYCSCNNQCSENEGDCDFDNQCQGRQKCRSNSCPYSLGFDSNTDCCVMPTVGDEDFCSTDEPCGVDEGHCEDSSECRNDLSCGFKNCPKSLNVWPDIDCCEPKGKYYIFHPWSKELQKLHKYQTKVCIGRKHREKILFQLGGHHTSYTLTNYTLLCAESIVGKNLTQA